MWIESVGQSPSCAIKRIRISMVTFHKWNQNVDFIVWYWGVGLTYRKRTSLVPFVNHSSNYILLNINWKIPCALASYESVSQILKKEEMRVLDTFKCQHEFYTSSIRINNQTGAWGNLRDHVTHSHPLSPNLRFVRVHQNESKAPHFIDNSYLDSVNHRLP